MKFPKYVLRDILKHTTQSLWGAFLIFGIPMIIYYLVDWDPVVRRDEYGELTITFGLLVILILYWIALILIVKYRSDAKLRESQITKLLNGSMNGVEKALIKSELKYKNK